MYHRRSIHALQQETRGFGMPPSRSEGIECSKCVVTKQTGFSRIIGVPVDGFAEPMEGVQRFLGDASSTSVPHQPFWVAE